MKVIIKVIKKKDFISILKRLGYEQMMLVIIATMAGIVRLVPIITEQVLFHFDSARDWLWVRDLVVNHHLMLVGPWSSLQGVFYGPLTYYLLGLFFILFRGNPIGGSIYALLINLLGIIFIGIFLKKKLGKRVAWITALLLAFSPWSMYISTFIFQTNPSWLLGVLILPILWQLSRSETRNLPWLGLLIGLGVETNFFWTIFLVPYLVWIIIKVKPNLKLILVTIIALLTPVVPQLIFEVRHNWLQVKSVMGFLKGTNLSLGSNAPFIDRLIDRPKLIFESIQGTIGIGNLELNWLVLGITGIILVRNWKKFTSIERKWFKYLGGLVVCFLVGSIAFPAQFKVWYFYPLIPILAVMTALIWSKGLKYWLGKIILVIYLVTFVVVNAWQFWPHRQPKIEENMKLLANQKLVVEKILELGKDSKYEVYVYTGSIYDYPYQYLFWWNKQVTGEGPIKYAYLPQKDDYVLNKKAYESAAEPVKTIFLVLEKDNPASSYRWETWLPAFNNYQLVKTVNLSNGVRLEQRMKDD